MTSEHVWELKIKGMEINKIYNIDCIQGIKNIPKDIINPIIVTDPPFNIGYKYNSYNDNKTDDEYYEWLQNIFCNYHFVVIHYPESIYRISFQMGLFPNRIISWVYNSNTSRQHRDIGFFGVSPNFSQIRQPYKNLGDKRIQERIKNGHVGSKLYDWFEINQVKNVSAEKTEHPCQMPIQVMRNIIGLLPYECTIIEPFTGSGTTICAIQDMNTIQNCNRKFIGFEIDKKYFDIANKRIFNNRNLY